MRSIGGVLVLVLFLGGCVSATSGGVNEDRRELDREQITAAGQSSALEVVRSERPHWLLKRGNRSFTNDGELTIYVDGSRIGGPETLRNISAIEIQSMRYYSDREAQYKWGAGHLHGAIEIIMRNN